MNLKIFLATLFGLGFAVTAAGASRPNVLWIVVEDMSLPFGCYGETAIETPHVDALATSGIQYDRAFVTSPVCSASRSAMITGMYQTSIGAHHHRSGRGSIKILLPGHILPLPALVRGAGYWTSNGVWPTSANKLGRIGKTDYNFVWPEDMYDGATWDERADDQPFFAQIQLRGGKYRKVAESNNWPEGWEKTSPARVNLPPYYPRDPVILQDWADYLDSARYVDHCVGQIVQKLKDDGDYENTFIIFMTDHGISHARGKQFCYEEGARIPFIIRGPGIEAGKVNADLVQQIDMAPTTLGWVGVRVPESMEGVQLFGMSYRPRDYLVVARDRCDETVDRIRAVRTARFKYIRNYYPARPHLQPCAYKDKKPIIQRIRELGAEGKLNDTQQTLLLSESRSPEEFYDLEADPFEIVNLALNPLYESAVATHRDMLRHWDEQTQDQGKYPEPESMYNSDMKAYVIPMEKKDPEQSKKILENIAQMATWADEGK